MTARRERERVAYILGLSFISYDWLYLSLHSGVTTLVVLTSQNSLTASLCWYLALSSWLHDNKHYSPSKRIIYEAAACLVVFSIICKISFMIFDDRCLRTRDVKTGIYWLIFSLLVPSFSKYLALQSHEIFFSGMISSS